MGKGHAFPIGVSIYTYAMVRPVTGQTPIKIRVAKSRAKNEAEGGRRIIVDLPGDGAAALKAVQERDGTNITDSVTNALTRFAKVKKKTGPA